MSFYRPTELTVLLKRRRERDQAGEQVRYRGYDVFWPDGRPVSTGVQRFCQQGTRLLLGRSVDPEQALVQITLYPVDGLDAALTRPGTGVRCRRFYALRQNQAVRLYFFTGTPTEVCFDLRQDDPEVLRWLHAESLRAWRPFWFDLGSRVLTSLNAPALQLAHEGQPG
jgi:hypothetical protein